MFFIIIGVALLGYATGGLFVILVGSFSIASHENISFFKVLFSDNAIQTIGFLAVTFASGVYIARIGAEDNDKKAQEQSQ